MLITQDGLPDSQHLAAIHKTSVDDVLEVLWTATQLRGGAGWQKIADAFARN